MDCDGREQAKREAADEELAAVMDVVQNSGHVCAHMDSMHDTHTHMAVTSMVPWSDVGVAATAQLNSSTPKHLSS